MEMNTFALIAILLGVFCVALIIFETAMATLGKWLTIFGVIALVVGGIAFVNATEQHKIVNATVVGSAGAFFFSCGFLMWIIGAATDRIVAALPKPTQTQEKTDSD
jgi:membrane-bound ClpP family serine protease